MKHIDLSTSTILNETEWHVHSVLVQMGGTATIAEVAEAAGMKVVSADTALRNMKYKDVLTSTRKKGDTPATFTIRYKQPVTMLQKEDLKSTWKVSTSKREREQIKAKVSGKGYDTVGDFLRDQLLS